MSYKERLQDTVRIDAIVSATTFLFIEIIC